MKSIMTMASVAACFFALTACGGGSDSGSTLSRADEGIWSNFDGKSNTFYNWMQAVILSDGSYWGVVGQVTPPHTQNEVTTFAPFSVLHGTASVDGNSISGTYVDFGGTASFAGDYSGTVSSKKSIDMIFNDPNNNIISMEQGHFNLSYDGAYNRPASLSAIAGNYLSASGGYGNSKALLDDGYYYMNPNLVVSGSNLTLADGNVIMTGTITPHGTTVNVFDVSLTTATIIPAYSMAGLFSKNDIPAGTVYKGILFQTSFDSQKNYIEIVAAIGDSAYFYIGSKQD